MFTRPAVQQHKSVQLAAPSSTLEAVQQSGTTKNMASATCTVDNNMPERLNLMASPPLRNFL
jgi:hypothetical protein